MIFRHECTCTVQKKGFPPSHSSICHHIFCPKLSICTLRSMNCSLMEQTHTICPISTQFDLAQLFRISSQRFICGRNGKACFRLGPIYSLHRCCRNRCYSSTLRFIQGSSTCILLSFNSAWFVPTRTTLIYFLSTLWLKALFPETMLLILNLL